MRYLVLGTLLLLPLLAASAADVDDTPYTRMAAAQKYLAATDFANLMDAGIRVGLQGAPDDKKEELFAMTKRHLDYERVTNLALAAMVKNFTTKELNALAAFYGSPEGKSALAKYPAYMSDVMPALMAEVQRVTAEIKAELEAKGHSSTGT
jgi:hypothetical protein